MFLLAMCKSTPTIFFYLAPSSNLVATFNETITRGTGDIVIKESGGTIIFETLDIQSANITIGGTDNRTLTRFKIRCFRFLYKESLIFF